MNAVIIYDDPACAIKARTTLENAAGNGQRAEGINWQIKLWQFEILALSPAMSDRAVVEAADAHLIILALRQPGTTEEWLQDWLEEWAGCRQVQNAALAVWSGGASHSLCETIAPELSAFAQRHGLSFVFDRAGRPFHNSAAARPKLARPTRKTTRPECAARSGPAQTQSTMVC